MPQSNKALTNRAALATRPLTHRTAPLCLCGPGASPSAWGSPARAEEVQNARLVQVLHGALPCRGTCCAGTAAVQLGTRPKPSTFCWGLGPATAPMHPPSNQTRSTWRSNHCRGGRGAWARGARARGSSRGSRTGAHTAASPPAPPPQWSARRGGGGGGARDGARPATRWRVAMLRHTNTNARGLAARQSCWPSLRIPGSCHN